MGIDKKNYQSTTPRVDTLDKLKGTNFQHFEISQKNENPPEYPYNFLRYIKANWSSVCRVMNWLDAKKAPPSFDYFRISKYPEKVVKTIQQKIIELGGKLPRYGVDGKFGRETTSALQQVIPTISRTQQPQPSSPKPPKPAPAPQNTPAPTSPKQSQVPPRPTQSPKPPAQPKAPRKTAPTKPRENTPFSPKLMTKMRTLMLRAMPAVQSTLAKAGLSFKSLDQLLSKKNLSQADLDSVRARSTRLRSSLSSSHPMLSQLNTIFNKASPEISRALNNLGSSTSLFQGLEMAMGRIEKVFDKYEKQMKMKLDDKALLKLINQVGMEKLGAFFIVIVYEVVISLELSLRKKNKTLLSLKV